MKAERLISIFKILIADWQFQINEEYSNTLHVETDGGSIPANSFFPEEERKNICDAQRDKILPLLNEEEKMLFLKTFDADLRECWGLTPKSAFPSSLSIMTNMPTQVLEHQKMYLFNQIVEIQTAINMKHKIENMDTPDLEMDEMLS